MQSGLSKDYVKGWERFNHWLHNNYSDEALGMEKPTQKKEEGKKDEQTKQK